LQQVLNLRESLFRCHSVSPRHFYTASSQRSKTMEFGDASLQIVKSPESKSLSIVYEKGRQFRKYRRIERGFFMIERGLMSADRDAATEPRKTGLSTIRERNLGAAQTMRRLACDGSGPASEKVSESENWKK